MFIVTVFDGPKCIGIAPFFIANQEPLGRVLRIMGSGEACADYLSILSLSTDADRVAKSISDWMRQRQDERGCCDSSLPQWDLMELDGLDSECPTLRAFLHSIESNGFGVRLSSKVNTWRLSISDSMDDYLSQLSKQSRRKIRTAIKRFDSHEFQVSIASRDDEFDAAWNQLIALHQRRRNSLGESGCFASGVFNDFLLDVAKAFFESGMLDLVSVARGECIIATELCFRGLTTTFAYQIGIEPDSLKENPGWLVNAASIRHAMRQEQSGFDWCRGDEEYKRRLGASPKPCLQCRVVPPTFRSQIWDAALLGHTTVKEWLKTGLYVSGIRS